LTNIYTEASNALPGLQVNVHGFDYASTALQIRSVKSPASDFYFIEAIANSDRIFYVRGDGAVGFSKMDIT
jgi:hypothetical protein